RRHEPHENAHGGEPVRRDPSHVGGRDEEEDRERPVEEDGRERSLLLLPEPREALGSEPAVGHLMTPMTPFRRSSAAFRSSMVFGEIWPSMVLISVVEMPSVRSR